MMRHLDLRAGVVLALAAMSSWLATGPAGLIAAALVVGVTVIEGLDRAGRHAAFAAAACLGGSIVLTVFEQPLAGEPTLRFATDRPVASSLGAFAGALLVTAVVLGCASATRRTDADD